MAELIFEIGTEEIPSWYLLGARDNLVSLLAESLKEASIPYEGIKGYCTPRRLAVRVLGLAERSGKRFEKRRGPSLQAAFEPDGSYSKATLAFAESCRAQPEHLQKEDSDKGSYLIAYVEQGGELTLKLLPRMLSLALENLSAPRKMRWTGSELSFIRPLLWLLAMVDEAVVPLELAGLQAGKVTYGHRFLSPQGVGLEHAQDYEKLLEAHYVLSDFDIRRKITWQRVMQLSQDKGLIPSYDAELLAEVTNLIEYPFAILGSFEKDHLNLPTEVLTTVMMHHQRFFPIRHISGQLAPYFVAVTNNRIEETKVRANFERVLAGRLYDAQFFWQSDSRKSLSQHAWSLSGIIFEKQLGTMADRVSRIADGALWLADWLKLNANDRQRLDSALPILRADLASQMVREYPELEGTMGREYALLEGYNKEVAQLLEEGIRPRSLSDRVPETVVGGVLAATDRMDKLLGFFAVARKPSGSADPFGLRRDGSALARILASQGWQLPLSDFINVIAQHYHGLTISDEVKARVLEFIFDRVSTLLAEEGISNSIFKAASADQPPVIRIARRSHVLKQLNQIDEFNDLLQVYKRTAKLAAEADESEVKPRLFESSYEHDLFIAAGVAKLALHELFEWTRSTLTPWDLGKGPKQNLNGLRNYLSPALELKVLLDEFFANVLVKVEQDKLRRNRLALLREVKQSFMVLGGLELLT